MEIKIPKRKPGGHGPKVEKKFREGAIAFFEVMKEIQAEIGFKVSPRGWGYIFEGRKLITKPQIDDVELAINQMFNRVSSSG